MKTVLLFRTSFSPQNKFEYKAMFDFAATWIKKSNGTIRHIASDIRLTTVLSHPSLQSQRKKRMIRVL